MIQQIKQLIPFVCENFMTFPLAEEGDYRPTINVWQIYNDTNDMPSIDLFNEKHEGDIYVSYEMETIYSPDVEEMLDVLFEKGDYPNNIIAKRNEPAKYYVEYHISNDSDATENNKMNLNKLLTAAHRIVNFSKQREGTDL